MATVIIGSKLPNGLILRHPIKQEETVEIKGLNSAPRGHDKKPIYIAYATTEVDKQFWDDWKLVHNHASKPFAPLASGAIFEAKSEAAAKDISKEQSKRLTGLEPMAQDGDERMGADKNKVKPAVKE